MRNKRKGFTLVELLIVIVVIGILSAMMMLSSSEAVSSSRATQITANMRSLQTAALAYWTDNMNTTLTGTQLKTAVLKYLKDENNAEIGEADYTINTDNGWHVMFTFSTETLKNDTRLKEKIASRAGALGLKSGTGDTAATYKNENTIYLHVR